ncbi:MAG TPA: hypothetical protein VK137_08775 [Planctomycetaceae bacterium]|nr:hypothetical protein [Planctomycetaceae bacterium]
MLLQGVESRLQGRANFGFRSLRNVERHSLLRSNGAALIRTGLSLLVQTVEFIEVHAVLLPPVSELVGLLPGVLTGALVAADELLLLIAPANESVLIVSLILIEERLPQGTLAVSRRSVGRLGRAAAESTVGSTQSAGSTESTRAATETTGTSHHAACARERVSRSAARSRTAAELG